MAAPDSFPVGQAPWETQGASDPHPDSFPVGKAPWEMHAEQSPDQQMKENSARLNEAGHTTNESLANSLLMGHYPQVKAKLGQVFSGEGISNDQNYVSRRDQAIAEMNARNEKYPAAHIQGEVAGVALPMLVTGGGSAVEQGLVKASLKGAAIGAGMGGAQNPGDKPGVVDPMQFDQRKNNAETGAIVGGGIGAIANKIPAIAEGVEGIANTKAVKAVGAMLKDFRKEYANDSVEQTGKFILDHGLVKAGDTFESVAEKAENLKDETGKALGAGYDAAVKVLPRLNPEVAAKVESAGFNPVRDKAEILSAVKKDLGYSYKGKAALNGVSDYLDQLAEEHGDKVLNPQITNEVKTALDKSAINWERNPLAREPDSEAALKSLRGVLSDKVSSQVQALGEAIGDPKAAEKLSELNSKYGMASKVARIAGDRSSRENANAAIGLRDSIWGAAGTAAGAAVGGVPGALIGGAVGAGAGKVARTYGPAVVASGANKTAKILAALPESTIAKQVANPGVYKTLSNLNGSDNSSQPSAPEQKITAPPSPLKGQEKWANDGAGKLLDHVETDDDKALIEKAKSQISSSPEVKKLLIVASDLTPGSKAMTQVLTRIKSKLAKDEQ